MKEIEIFVRVHYHDQIKSGKGLGLFRFKDHIRELYLTIDETTHNRSIISMATKAVLELKESCDIKLYTQSNFGFLFMLNNKKWTNRDLGNKLSDAISSGGHTIQYIDCSSYERGKEFQESLKKRIK